eukprot:3087996-Amphidinium_carterae.3
MDQFLFPQSLSMRSDSSDDAFSACSSTALDLHLQEMPAKLTSNAIMPRHEIENSILGLGCCFPGLDGSPQMLFRVCNAHGPVFGQSWNINVWFEF